MMPNGHANLSFKRVAQLAAGAIVLVTAVTLPGWILKDYCTANSDELVDSESYRVLRIYDAPHALGPRALIRPPNALPAEVLRVAGSNAQVERSDQFARGNGTFWRRFWCEINGADYALALFTVFLALSTIGLWIVTRRSLLHAMSESERQARDTFEALSAARKSADAAVAARRAWLTVECTLAAPLVFGAPGALFGVKVITRNIGNSPATHVKVWAVAVPVEIGDLGPNSQINSMSKARIIADHERPADVGYSLFPGSEAGSDFKYTVQITKDEMDVAIGRGTRGPMILISLTVIVDYRFAGGEGRSVAVFNLWGRDPYTDGEAPLDSSLSQMIPNDLILQRLAMSDVAI